MNDAFPITSSGRLTDSCKRKLTGSAVRSSFLYYARRSNEEWKVYEARKSNANCCCQCGEICVNACSS